MINHSDLSNCARFSWSAHCRPALLSSSDSRHCSSVSVFDFWSAVIRKVKTMIWTYKSVDSWFTNYNLDFGFELFRSKKTRKRISRGQYFQRFFGNSTNIWTIKAFSLFFQNVSETSFIFYVSRFSWILCQMKWNFIFFFRIISNPYILA